MPELLTLLERCRQGDDLAWEALVRQHQARVYGLAVHFLSDRDEARDAAQEVFVKVYQHLGRFDLEQHERFLPWVLRLTRNACIDRLRARKSRPPARDLPLDDGPEVPAGTPSPEQASLSASRKRLLYRALQRLSDINREMILLKEIQGLELQEIAEMLAVPLGTVKSRSNRARIELAKAVMALDPSFRG